MTVTATVAFADMLTGGHRNALGRTGEVVDIVVADRSRLEELFATLFADDEVVRMRAGDALEKVCRRRPQWFAGHVERLLGDVGAIAQPSVRWHVAQMLQRLRGELSAEQAARATELLERNLTGCTDWIVLNVTMDVLAEWAGSDAALAAWLEGELERLSGDGRPSVARRASRHLAELHRRGLEPGSRAARRGLRDGRSRP